MPPEREAFLVKQCGLIAIQFLEDSPHERFANNTTAVLHSVFLTKAVEYPLFAVVEQNRYLMFARGLH